MNIYDYQTVKFTNFIDTQAFLEKKKNSKINILMTNQYLSLQGPHVMKDLKTLFTNKNINLIAEAGKNIGLILALIELEVEKISISKKLDNDLTAKIFSLAKKKGIDILITEMFKNVKNTGDFS